jgi:SAM-dependent methyltransferase
MNSFMHSQEWWEESSGFFGEFYIVGDNSQEGHLAARKLSLAERTKLEVNGVVRLLGLESTCAILDMPCGYGRHSIELASRSHVVTGADINEVHLRRARKDAAKQGVAISFERHNMLTLPYEEKFDAVINMFYSFGFFETDEKNLRVIRNFHKALLPGGKFLMHTDVNIPRIQSGDYKTQEVRSLIGGGRLSIDERFDETTRRIEGHWTIEHGQDRSSKGYSVRVYDSEEFVQICLEAGFASCTAYGDWNGRPYSTDAEEIIFVAQKGSD